MIITVLGSLIGIPSALVDNYNIAYGCFWLQFFLGGLCLPVMVGILLNMIPPSTKTIANSITNLATNLIGYFPAPFVYGIIYEMTGGGDSRWGLITIQCSPVLAGLALFLAFIIREAKKQRKHKKKEQYLQSGAAELIDNDQKGDLLSSSSDEEEYRVKKPTDMKMLYHYEEEVENSDEAEQRSIRTLSDRLKMDSISVFFSKSLVPTSLGIINDDFD